MEITLKQAEDIIGYHKYLYYVKNDPRISDLEYDKLEKSLKEKFPDSKIINSIECPKELWDRYELRYINKKKNLL